MGESQAISSRIVSILREYGQIPEGFLARRIARRPIEIEETLVDLEQRGVVLRQNEKVSLAYPKKKVLSKGLAIPKGGR